MPKGIVVIRWDDKLGALVEVKHPQQLEVTQDHIMRIFTTHTLGDSTQGFLSMKIEDLNVASYYSGIIPQLESQFCVSLLLNSDEEAELFEEVLVEAAVEILEAFQKPIFQEKIVESYENISKAILLEEDQRYALIFSDPLRLAILNKLTEGSVTRKELIDWVREQKNMEITDLNVTLSPFIRTGMVRFSFVEGITDECIFLVKDVFAIRTPVRKLIYDARNDSADPTISSRYIEAVEKFFSNYHPTPEDISKISALITDPEIYSLIKSLRENHMLKEELLKDRKNKGEYVKEALSKVLDSNLAETIIDADSKEWLCLISDIRFIPFFPEYIIDVIRQKWNNGHIDQKQAIRYLDLLLESFE